LFGEQVAILGKQGVTWVRWGLWVFSHITCIEHIPTLLENMGGNMLFFEPILLDNMGKM